MKFILKIDNNQVISAPNWIIQNDANLNIVRDEIRKFTQNYKREICNTSILLTILMNLIHNLGFPIT